MDGKAFTSHAFARNASLLAIAPGIALLAAFPNWTVDDAFITARYAENLVRFGELNWNPGSDPVEGYTGIVLPLIAAAAYFAGGSSIAAAKLVGVVSWLVALLALERTLTSLSVATSLRAAALLLCATMPCLFTHAISGLETSLFIAAMLVACATFLAACQARTPHWRWLLALTFTACVRPEGVLFAAFMLMACAWHLGVEDGILRWHGLRTLTWRAFAVVFSPLAIITLWRWLYYGNVLPNTYFAKNHTGGLFRPSAQQLAEFTEFYLALPLVAGGAFWLVAHGSVILKSRCERALVPVIVAFVAATTAKYLYSNLLMRFAYRFFAPDYPLLVLVLVLLIARCLETQAGRARQALVTGGALVLIAQLAVHGFEYRKERNWVVEYANVMSDSHERIAQWLRVAAPGDATLLVRADAGIVPYLTRLRTVDFGALSDEKLAQGGMTDSERIDYFFACNAGILMLTSRRWDRLVGDTELERIRRDRRFTRYRLVQRFGNRYAHRNYQFVYARQDLRLADTGVVPVVPKDPPVH